MALNDRQLKILDHFDSGDEVQEIAAQMGISRTTVWREASKPEFQEEARRRRQMKMDIIRHRFSAAAECAARVQIELATSAESEAVRLAASKEILSNAGLSDEVNITVDDRREITRATLATWLAEKASADNGAANEPAKSK